MTQLPPCEIQKTETPDEIWIPVVTKAGMAIITRDKAIQKRSHEKAVVAACGARMFAVTSTERLDNWGLLEVVVTQWRAMERAAEEEGPYIYALTRTTLGKIDLAV
jgi:PIN like domain